MLELVIVVGAARLLYGETRRCGVSARWAALGPVLYLTGEMQGGVTASYLGLEGGSILQWALSFGALGVLVAWALIAFHPRPSSSSKMAGSPTSR